MTSPQTNPVIQNIVDNVSHFHVMSSDPGCMPDTNDTYETFEDALAEAQELSETFYGEGETMVSRQTIDWERKAADFGLRRNGTSPGWVTHIIEVFECYEEACGHELI